MKTAARAGQQKESNAMTLAISWDGHDGSFGPEATRIIGEAYERACALLADNSNEAIRKTIAKRILELAGRGEWDPARLCEAALGASENTTVRLT
jgi:hypothetical protein